MSSSAASSKFLPGGTGSAVSRMRRLIRNSASAYAAVVAPRGSPESRDRSTVPRLRFGPSSPGPTPLSDSETSSPHGSNVPLWFIPTLLRRSTFTVERRPSPHGSMRASADSLGMPADPSSEVSPHGSMRASADCLRMPADRSSELSPHGLRRVVSSVVIQGGSVSLGQTRAAVPVLVEPESAMVGGRYLPRG